jgi:hypothetical protein
VLADYLRRRQRHWGQRPVSSFVFVSSWGHRLDNGDIHRTFYALCRQIGLRGATDRHGPRLHDMRQHAGSLIMPGSRKARAFRAAGHQFHACRFGIIRVLSSPRLIALWLGHEAIETTQVYIHADLRLKEKALARVAAPASQPTRYHADDQLLAFLESL